MTTSWLFDDALKPGDTRKAARGSVFSIWGPYVCLLCVGMVLSFPCWWAGLPQADDSGDHVRYQIAFDEQFWQGDLYPRWLGRVNRNMGSPILYVQYPVPYVSAALIGWTTAHSIEQVNQIKTLGVVAAVTLIASGFAAYWWLRSFVGPNAALLGALVYLAAPYHVCVDLYARAAIGELFAFVWAPLCLLYVHRVATGGKYGVAGIAISFGLLVMSHIFTAILLFPILVAQLLLFSHDRYRGMSRLIAGFLLSAGLSAVYLVPLIWYRSWFNFKVLTGPNWLFSNHFLVFHRVSYWSFVGLLTKYLGPIGRGPFPPKVMLLSAAGLATACWIGALYQFSRGEASDTSFVRRRVSMIGLAGIAFACVLLVLPWGRVELRPLFIGNMTLAALSMYLLTFIASSFALSGPHRHQASFFLGCAVASFLMMFPVSKLFWNILPPLRDIQFPWRLSAFLTLSAAFVLAAAAQYLEVHHCARLRLLLVSTIACVLAANLIAWDIPSRIHHPSRWEYLEAQLDPMLPVYVHSSDPNWLATHTVTSFVTAAPAVEVVGLKRSAGEASIRLRAVSTSSVKVSQLFFPNWSGWIDDKTRLPLRPSEPEGWISFDISPGSHDVLLTFQRAKPEWFGLITTLVSVVGLALWRLKAFFVGHRV